MAITPDALKALERYVRDCRRAGKALKYSIDSAVVLTGEQRESLSEVLSRFWGRWYPCPPLLDLKPHHGYSSRILKDNFAPEDLVLWFVAACADVAHVEADPHGRPRLVVHNMNDDKGRTYDLVAVVSSDAHGYVHINDVIPKGLPGRHKKTDPSADP